MLNKRNSKYPVHFLGPDGSFGHKVARNLFRGLDDPNSPWLKRPVSPQPDICSQVDKCPNSYGVLAIENTTSGIVSEVVLAIERSSRRRIRVVAEMDIDVPFRLYASKGQNSTSSFLAKGEGVDIFAHAVTQEQCQNTIEFLRAKYHAVNGSETGFTVTQMPSNSDAARLAAERDNGFAITNQESATLYGLHQVTVDVDRPPNHTVSSDWNSCVNDYVPSRTRFWVIANFDSPAVREDQSIKLRYKTSFLIYLDKHASGVLCAALIPFKSHKIPVHLVFPCIIPGRGWEYTFLLEVEGHIDSEPLSKAYSELLRMRWLFPVPPSYLGSYVDLASRSDCNGVPRDEALSFVQDRLLLHAEG